MNGLTKKLKRKLESTWKPMKMIKPQPKTSGNAAKVVIRGKYIAIQAFLKKEERSQIHNLTLHLKELEKEEQIKSKNSRRQEIEKIRAEINTIETKTKQDKQNKKTVEQINETRSCFFERISKIDKPLARLLKKKKERTQINT